jgi:ribosomal protein S18 acetylase RimI-like enzyme
MDDSQPQVMAVVEDNVVGFCDILPNAATGFTHVGRLGMGVRSEWRRQGIGRRMLDACLSLARNAGIEKVELEVFSDNVAAVRLYDSFGFSEEGLKARGRKRRSSIEHACDAKTAVGGRSGVVCGQLLFCPAD